MVNVAVFASGYGSNLESILEHVENGSLPVDVRAVISDKENAYARARAISHDVPEFFFNTKVFKSKEDYEKAILAVLKEREVDLIVLSGYMRYIGKVLLEAYPNRIINIHPALLPNFPGAHGIKDAYEAKVPVTGVTVHYVDEGIDTGKIIHQEEVAVDPAWSLEELETAVHKKEHDMFWRVIKDVAAEIESQKKEEEKSL